MNFKIKFLSMIFISLFFVGFGSFLVLDNIEGANPYSNGARFSCNDSGTISACGSGCFYTDNYVHSDSNNDLGACVVRKSVTLPAPVSCHPAFIFDNSCSDTEQACLEDKCPSSEIFPNGAICTVALGKSAPNPFDSTTAVVGFPSTKKIGKWDASQKKCVSCSGNKEYQICADTSSIRIDDGSRECADGEFGGTTFETACSNSVSAACDDKKEGDSCNPPAGGTCNSTGQCIVTASALTVTPNPTEIDINTSTSITFTVKSGGSGVTGAIVSISGAGVSSANCTTGGSGNCTINNVTATIINFINATATRTGYTDGLTSIMVLPVAVCPVDVSIPALSASLASVEFGGLAAIGDTNTYCLYNPANSNVDDLVITNTVDTKNYTPGSAGIWTVSAHAGNISCPLIPGLCLRVDTVSAPALPPIPAGCLNDGIQNNGETGIDCGGGGCPAGTSSCATTACTGAPGTLQRDCTNSCDGLVTSSTPTCCDNNSHCENTDICDASAGAYGVCQPCSAEGESPANATMCCDGLNFVDDGAGTMICSSRCDPTKSFFCNPLRGTVETLVQGGEKMIGYILGTIGSVALLLIIMSGTMYMTSAGNEEKIASSKKILTGAVIGLGIALLAFSLLEMLISIL